MDNQQCVNRRRRNLPAELKVEIVDCFPVENAVHFLANVPNRLIIHHCAPRLRRMLKMNDQIAKEYTRTLPISHGDIWLMNGHQYTPEMAFFLRYGGPYSNLCFILRGTGDGFVGYPGDFFNDLIEYYYEAKVPTKAVHHLDISLSLNNPAPWPTVLLQPQAAKIKVEELEVNDEEKLVIYMLHNKHNPGIAFNLFIFFEGGEAQCYRKMTQFVMRIWE